MTIPVTDALRCMGKWNGTPRFVFVTGQTIARPV